MILKNILKNRWNIREYTIIKNKENKEYKTRKNNNLKKYLEVPGNYEKHLKAVITRNKNVNNSREAPRTSEPTAEQPNSQI